MGNQSRMGEVRRGTDLSCWYFVPPAPEPAPGTGVLLGDSLLAAIVRSSRIKDYEFNWRTRALLLLL